MIKWTKLFLSSLFKIPKATPFQLCMFKSPFEVRKVPTKQKENKKKVKIKNYIQL